VILANFDELCGTFQRLLGHNVTRPVSPALEQEPWKSLLNNATDENGHYDYSKFRSQCGVRSKAWLWKQSQYTSDLEIAFRALVQKTERNITIFCM
jgi:hypothetical protein